MGAGWLARDRFVSSRPPTRAEICLATVNGVLLSPAFSLADRVERAGLPLSALARPPLLVLNSFLWACGVGWLIGGAPRAGSAGRGAWG